MREVAKGRLPQDKICEHGHERIPAHDILYTVDMPDGKEIWCEDCCIKAGYIAEEDRENIRVPDDDEE